MEILILILIDYCDFASGSASDDLFAADLTNKLNFFVSDKNRLKQTVRLSDFTFKRLQNILRL